MSEKSSQASVRMPNEVPLHFINSNGDVCEGSEKQKPSLEAAGWTVATDDEVARAKLAPKRVQESDVRMLGKVKKPVLMVSQQGDVYEVSEEAVEGARAKGWKTVDEAKNELAAEAKAAQDAINKAKDAAAAAKDAAAKATAEATQAQKEAGKAKDASEKNKP